MEDQQHLVFYRCWCGFTPRFPFTDFANVFCQKALNRRLQERAESAVKQIRAPDGTNEPPLRDLKDLCVAVGWRRNRRGGIFRYTPEGKLIDPLFLPPVPIAVAADGQRGELLLELLQDGLPSSVDLPLGYSYPQTPTLGLVRLSELGSAERLRVGIELRKLDEEIARLTTPIARSLRENRLSGTERLMWRLATRAVDVIREMNFTFASGGQVQQTVVEDEECREFRREDGRWVVTFAGLTKFLEHRLGLGYIHELLLDPAHSMSSADLAASANRVGSQEERLKKVATAPQDVAALGAGARSPDSADDQAASDYKRRLRELLDQEAEAKQLGDYDRLKMAHDERSKLLAELQTIQSAFSRRRKLSLDERRLRQRVNGNFKSALKELAQEHRPAYMHLAARLRDLGGAYPRYVPTDEVRWTL